MITVRKYGRPRQRQEMAYDFTGGSFNVSRCSWRESQGHACIPRKMASILIATVGVAVLAAWGYTCRITSGRVPELRWETQYLTLPVSEEYSNVSGKFNAINSGSKNIHIRSVTPSCPCVHCQYYPADVPPNHSVSIQVGIAGVISQDSLKTLMVDTDAGQYTLKLKVEVAKRVVMESRVLSWHVGDVPKLKYVQFHLNHPEDKADITSVDPRIVVSIKPDSADTDNYSLGVMPRSTVKSYIAQFALNVRSQDKAIRTINLYAIILP